MNSLTTTKKPAGQLEEFKISRGTAIFLAGIIAPKLDLGKNPFHLKGSIADKAEQTAQLFAQGIGVGNLEEGGMIARSDVRAALNVLWRFKTKGWSNYEAELIHHGICNDSKIAAAKSVVQKKG